MRRIIFYLITLTIIFANSCSNGQNKTEVQTKNYNLSVAEFSEKIKQMPAAPIIDVRTPGEFTNGHLDNAINVDWKSGNFDSKVSEFNKNEAVFVYCYSGNRSTSAANKMRSMGFKEVYELSGGIIKWRAAGMPETTANTDPSNGMNKKQYDQLLVSDKLVLVDFYAEWCAPCKKMKPYLDEIAKEMADKVKVIRIDADANKQLTKELGIDGLPVLFLYKNNILKWKNEGLISKEDIVKQIKSF